MVTGSFGKKNYSESSVPIADGMLSFEEFRDALSTLVLVDRNLTSDQPRAVPGKGIRKKIFVHYQYQISQIPSPTGCGWGLQSVTAAGKKFTPVISLS